MVIIKKIEVTDKKITYSYQPEGNGDLGIVSYIPTTGEFFIEKMSDRESKEFNMYRSKAFWWLKKFSEKGEFPDRKVIVWG